MGLLAANRDLAMVSPVLKEIRNRLLGHASLKAWFVQHTGLVQVLIAHLNAARSGPCDPAASAIAFDTVTILGSVAYGGVPEMEKLFACGLPQILLDYALALSSEEGHWDLRSIETCLRALRNIYRHREAPRDLPLSPKYLPRLVSFLALNGIIQEYVAVILASCCDGTAKQHEISTLGGLEMAIRMTLSSCGRGMPKCEFPRSHLEASLDLLAALTRENQEMAHAVSTRPDLVALFFEILQNPHNSPEVKIFASLCITNMVRSEGSETVKDLRVTSVLIPNLAKLLSRESLVRGRAAEILALLIGDSDTLQMAACEPEIIRNLSEMLQNPRTGALAEWEVESALLAFAAIASYKEECRKTIIEAAKIFPNLLAGMASANEKIRSAACSCTRSLSRSVKNLRTTLVDAGLTAPLLKLLRDPSVRVQRTACATLCNMVLDFSPMKETVLKEGGVELLVSLVSSIDSELRYNALWALKNLLYMADASIKNTAMELITYDRLEAFAFDPSHPIQEQALNLIRNLVCEKESEISEVIARFGEDRLISLAEAKLAAQATEVSEDSVMHTLYIVANVSTAAVNVPFKGRIIGSKAIVDRLKLCLSPGSAPTLQVAALWCVINLTWTDDSGSAERIDQLRRAGIEQALVNLQSVPQLSPDVRDRLQTALRNFSAISAPPTTAPRNSRRAR